MPSSWIIYRARPLTHKCKCTAAISVCFPGLQSKDSVCGLLLLFLFVIAIKSPSFAELRVNGGMPAACLCSWQQIERKWHWLSCLHGRSTEWLTNGRDYGYGVKQRFLEWPTVNLQRRWCWDGRMWRPDTRLPVLQWPTFSCRRHYRTLKSAQLFVD